MKRTALLVLLVLLLAGCEEQEAVPLSRSVPMALVQLVALVGPVVVGFLALERLAARRPGPVVPARRPQDVAGAVLFAVLGVAVLVPVAWWVLAVPGTYDQVTTNVFSWEDSVALAWFFLVPSVLVALLELRLAAACWARRRWATWGAGVQAVLALGCGIWSLSTV